MHLQHGSLKEVTVGRSQCSREKSLAFSTSFRRPTRCAAASAAPVSRLIFLYAYQIFIEQMLR